MDEKLQLKLQAYVDGELTGRDAREVAELLSNDAAARALVAELQNTRSALADFEAGIRVPESREFYWSKIAREIERSKPEPAPVLSPVSLSRLVRRWLVPAGALAAVVIAVLLAGTHLNPALPQDVEVALGDSDPFTYRDYSNGTTLVWLSYPAENEFADIDSNDTLN